MIELGSVEPASILKLQPVHWMTVLPQGHGIDGVVAQLELAAQGGFVLEDTKGGAVALVKRGLQVLTSFPAGFQKETQMYVTDCPAGTFTVTAKAVPTATGLGLVVHAGLEKPAWTGAITVGST